MIQIKTPRLILRPPEDNDIAVVQAAKEELWDELQLWMSWAFDDQYKEEAIKEYFDQCKIMLEEGSAPLLAFTRDTNEFAVSTGIHAMDKPNHYCTGYWASKSLQGKGFATETTNAAIRYAFAEMGAEEMHINYYDGNEKSRKVIEKLGFTFTGTREKAAKRCLDGTPLDIHDYIMHDPSVLPPLDVEFN